MEPKLINLAIRRRLPLWLAKQLIIIWARLTVMRKWLQITFLAAFIGAAVGVSAQVFWPHLSKELSNPTEPLPDEPAFNASTTNADKQTTSPASQATPESWPVSLAGKLAWPVTVIVALAMIAWNSRLRRVFGLGTRLVRKISAGGLEMEISADAVDEIRDKLRGSFRELVRSARDEFERMTDLQDVDRHLELVVETALLPEINGNRPEGLRATIHVRDIVFRDYLYQLVNYYPRGGGAHRRFSQRYGIIGRSWRSGKSHGTGNAFGNSPSVDSLIEEWGMTREETHGVLHTKPSCLSIVLHVNSVPVGILYVDSNDQNAFGDDDHSQTLAEALETKDAVKKLSEAIERTLTPLRVGGPNLDLKELG